MDDKVLGFAIQIIESVPGEKIPGGVAIDLARYLILGTPPGGFVRAVLENDLLRSYLLADSVSLRALPSIVRYLYAYAPAIAWGSKEKVEKWIRQKESK